MVRSVLFWMALCLTLCLFWHFAQFASSLGEPNPEHAAQGAVIVSEEAGDAVPYVVTRDASWRACDHAPDDCAQADCGRASDWRSRLSRLQ